MIEYGNHGFLGLLQMCHGGTVVVFLERLAESGSCGGLENPSKSRVGGLVVSFAIPKAFVSQRRSICYPNYWGKYKVLSEFEIIQG